MTSNYSDTEIKTKEIYIEQHKNYRKDKSIFQRHLNSAVDLATYDVDSDYFSGKSILDAGCGNTGYFQVAMFRLGAKHVTCLDIGDDWKCDGPEFMIQGGYGMATNSKTSTNGRRPPTSGIRLCLTTLASGAGVFHPLRFF